MVSQKDNKSVPHTFMLVYTVSFSATFMDVNFRGTNALKLCTMIHYPTLITQCLNIHIKVSHQKIIRQCLELWVKALHLNAQQVMYNNSCHTGIILVPSIKWVTAAYPPLVNLTICSSKRCQEIIIYMNLNLLYKHKQNTCISITTPLYILRWL